MQKNIQRVVLRVLAGLVLFQPGCGFFKSSDPADVPLSEQTVPEKWSSEEVDPVTVQPWLADFNDPMLTDLVKEALHNNRDLRAAAARLAASDATNRLVSGNVFPTVSGEFSTDNNWREGSDTGNGSDSRRSSTHSLGLRVSWEADIWAKIADQSDAATAEYLASRADYRAFELSLAANVVKAWFRVIEAVQVERLAVKRYELAEQTAKVIEESYNRGLTSSSEFHSALEKKASAAATLAVSEVDRDGEIRNLEALLGRYPASRIDASVADFPHLEKNVPAGLPSELLARRPDLVAARHRLLASEKRLRATEKNLLPTFKLTAAGGTISDELHNLLDWDYLVLKLAGNIMQVLVDGGQTRAGADLDRAKRDERISLYGAALLNGFREVETALAADRYYRIRQQYVGEALSEIEEVQRRAEERYRLGIGDILSVLTSRSASLNGRENQIKINSARLQARINLYLALGGDY